MIVSDLMIADHKAETCSLIHIWIINLHNRMQSIKVATEIIIVYLLCQSSEYVCTFVCNKHTHMHTAFAYVSVTVHTVIMSAFIVCIISSYLII